MIEDKQIHRLVEIGLLACHKGLPAEGRTIFTSLLSYNPNLTPAVIGLAFSHLVVGELSQAEEILAQVLAPNPHDQEALALLGLIKHFSGQKDEASQIFEGLAPGDNLAAKLAQELKALS